MGHYGVKPASSNMMETGSLDRTKASSEEPLSYGDINSFKSPEVREVVMIENLPEEKDQTKEDHPTLSHPVARIGAFTVYTPPNGTPPRSLHPRTDPMQGPFSICKFLEGITGEPVVPSRCGHGCCASGPSGSSSRSSLLGPEFVEYEELPPFPSQELAAIATDLNNIAWIKGSLDNIDSTIPKKATGQMGSQGGAVQMGIFQQSTRNENHHFGEGQKRLMGLRTDVGPMQLHFPTFAFQAQVEGLS